MNVNLKVSLTLVAFMISVAAPQMVLAQTVPNSNRATKIDGPGSSGGGNGCGGKLYESSSFDPLTQFEKLPGLKYFIDKLSLLKSEAENAGDKVTMQLMEAFLSKRWYLLECNFENLPMDELGYPGGTEQLVIQTEQEMFISTKLSLETTLVNTMLFHEMLVGALLQLKTGKAPACADCKAQSDDYILDKKSMKELFGIKESEMSTFTNLKGFYPGIRKATSSLVEQYDSLNYSRFDQILQMSLPIIASYRSKLPANQQFISKEIQFDYFSGTLGIGSETLLKAITNAHQSFASSFNNQNRMKLNTLFSLSDIKLITANERDYRINDRFQSWLSRQMIGKHDVYRPIFIEYSASIRTPTETRKIHLQIVLDQLGQYVSALDRVVYSQVLLVETVSCMGKNCKATFASRFPQLTQFKDKWILEGERRERKTSGCWNYVLGFCPYPDVDQE